MSQLDAEALKIDSPIHQIRQVEAAIADTGTGMLFVVGIREMAERLAGLSADEISSELDAMTMLPEFVMNGRPEVGLPVLAAFVFVPQPLADELDSVSKDSVEEITEDD